MKKLFSIMVLALLVISVMPVVLADDAVDTSGIVTITVEPEDETPEICTDTTQRSWNPNDQTQYTANEYGNQNTNLYGDIFFDVPLRGNYVFTGETVMYYVIVSDADGDSDIDTVDINKKEVVSGTETGAGSCGELTPPSDGDVNAYTGGTYTTWADYATDKFCIDAWDDATMNLYGCQLVIQSSWTGANEVSVKATDLAGLVANSTWTDFLTMNPDLEIDLLGSITFGPVEEGTTVTSNSVQLQNIGNDGVVMDMYIASTDYFTDPTGASICGIGNGIPHCAFSYYATKGSMDSGSNDNSEPGLGRSSAPVWAVNGCDASKITCEAEADEFTKLPSHSGKIDDMCRIINHNAESSILTQGQAISLTFQLEVPTPCDGTFTDGRFHFAGRVV